MAVEVEKRELHYPNGQCSSRHYHITPRAGDVGSRWHGVFEGWYENGSVDYVNVWIQNTCFDVIHNKPRWQ